MKTLFMSGLLLGILGFAPYAANARGPVQYAGESCGCESCDDCNTCDVPCGKTCGRGACCDRTPCGPLTFLFSIFECNTWRGPSCGERYWGDFYSDPPACHDPCDQCGNYVGRTYSSGNWGSGRGYSSGYSSGSGGGCNCNKQRTFDDQPIPMEGRVHSSSVRVSRQPTPAKQPSKAVRTQ
jgi:hypothetical protein